MKVYISVDIEGVTGITHWDETDKAKGDYQRFVEQMTKEAQAACQGAVAAGVEEIWVKDAHETGRNIDPVALPQNVRLIRGWSGHPFSMVQGLDNSFDAVLFIGYHSAAGTNHNPLAHTMHATGVRYIKINEQYVSEFLLHAYAAATVGVPVVFVSGDEGLATEVKRVNPSIRTLGVNKGIGNATVSIHPDRAIDLIAQEVQIALERDLGTCQLTLPKHFTVEISYTHHPQAYKASFYPGMKQISSNNVVFETDDYFEVLRMINFLV